ncbi:tetratricopeptide repeat protein [Schlesneria sp. T3-172]|uniref:tetratricopeptide repeat protein n=1 Tax=Schlesneria sphaerica TaxID=3373610 RepID=UPI0037C68A41
MISLLGLAGGLYLLHSFQMSRNSQAYVRAAKRALAENRMDVAAAYLRRYVLLAPKDPEGLILFGQLLEDSGRPDQAYAMMDRALKLVPDRSDVRRHLVRTSLQIGRYSEAVSQIEEYLLKENPKDAEALTQLSTCFFSLNRFDEAERPLETAIEADPTYLKSYTMLASLRHERLNRASDANLVIDQMVTENPNDPMAYYYRAQWLAERLAEPKSSRKLELQNADEMLEQAEKDIKQAIKLDPDNADIRQLAIFLAYTSNKLDELREHAEHGIRVYPTDHRFYVSLAELERMQKNTPAAFDVLMRGVAAAPDNLPIKWSLADIAIELGKFSEAEGLIRRLSEEKYRRELVAYLEAKSAIYRQDWLTAIDLIESFRNNLRDRPDLAKDAEFWLGMAHGETLSLNQQLISLRRSVALDPNYAQSRLELANALSNAGLLSEAIAEYEQLLTLPKAPVPAAIGLVKALLAWNLTHPATWDEFDKVLLRMEGEPSLQDQVALFRMEKHLAHDDVAGAEKVVAEARAKKTDSMELWQAEISLALLQSEWDKAEQLIQSANEHFGDTVRLRLIKARYVMRHRGPDTIAQLLKLAEKNSKWTDAEYRELAGGLVPLFSNAGDQVTAEKLGREIAAAEPKNLPVRLALLDIALSAKKPDLMASVLEEVKGIAGEKAVWHYGQALRLSLSSNGAPSESDAKTLRREGLAHLSKAKTTAPNWSRIPLLAGEISEQLGDPDQAADYYLEAIRLGDRSTAVSGRTLALLFKLSKFDAAANLIRELKESHVSFTEEMHRAEVDIALELGRSKEALKATEDLVRVSKEALDPLWLGQVYATLGNYKLAEPQFREAIALNKSDPKAWIGLVQVLVLSGKKNEVDSIIAEEQTALSGEQAPLTIGLSYELAGKFEQARQIYQTAYDKTPQSLTIGHRLADYLMKVGDNSSAEAVLRKMIKVASSGDMSHTDQLPGVQRKLARVLMSRGGQDQLGEALGIVERHLAVNPNSVEDAHLKAVILANTASTVQQQQAVAILEKLLRQNPSSATSADDRFLLARLYVQAGDRPKARNELKKLITTRKDDPRYYNAYAQLSLQSGELTEAELYLGILQKLAPKELSTSELEAQLLFRKEQYADVVRLLKGIANSRSIDPSKADSTVKFKLWAAKSLEEFGRRLEQMGQSSEAAKFAAEAEALYKKYIEDRPEEMLALAEFLVQTSEIDRALDLLQEHGAKSSPMRIASVAVAMMKNPQATTAQMSRLQSLIDANISTHADSPLIPLISADLKSWRGHYGEALNGYRTILSRDEKNIPALNNLAVLLALTGGDANEAHGLIQRALDAGGPVHVLLDSRGLINLSSGHPEKSVGDFEGAVSQRETAERRFHVARAYAALKQHDAARKAIQRAQQLSLREHELHPLERPFLKELLGLLQEQAAQK